MFRFIGPLHLPMMIIVNDEGLTESQKLEIAEAEKQGQNIIMIVRDDYSPE